MAFQNLRSSNQLYILHKDPVPNLEIGKILTVSMPVPKYGNANLYNPEMVVDITADVEGTSTNFQKLPAQSEIADFGNNVVVSCNRDAMNSEINAMKQKGLDVINSVELHKKIIQSCDIILERLNPEIAEKQRQDQENKELRDELNSLKNMFKEFMSQSLNKKNNDNNNRSTERKD